jgi:nucleotide-binding universal stress UspA family protein
MEFSPLPSDMVTHILIPVDGSELSEGALQAAIALAQRLDARLTVFYALPTAGAYAYATVPLFVDTAELHGKTLEEIHQLVVDSAGIYLKGLVARVQQAGDPHGSIQVASECVESDEPHRAILDAAQRMGCDLIVMASHGRRGLGALLLGSETQKVLTHSTLPVLVWRPPAVSPAS